MKFLADMGISPRVVEELRQKGHDAVHLAEQGLHRMVDGDILQKARQENRVLLTHDLDFGELLAAWRGIAKRHHLSPQGYASPKCQPSLIQHPHATI